MDSPYTPRLAVNNDNKKGKIINDPVHGHMEFESEVVKAIDTVYFQRLRELKQLGSADWVFPGAVHTRFIHSLGVSYLASSMMRRLQTKQPELRIQDRDVLLVSLAGLCHDLGHGPFSHGFERVVQIVLEEERKKGTDVPPAWHHEHASEMLFEQVVKEGGLDLKQEEIQLVKAMIRGVKKKEPRPMGKPLYLFQIVANKQTGMDVDKYDYLLRDAMFCGAKIAFDITRLLRPQVREDTDGDLILSYYIKEEWMIHQLFRSRFDLHHQVYGHSVVVALQLMIEEVLILAKDWLRITEAIKCPKLYLYLTDHVIHRIECLKPENAPVEFPTDDLKKAQELIRRIKQRDLYTSILHDVNLPVDLIRVKEDRLHAEKKLKSDLIRAKPELEQFSGKFIVAFGDRDFTCKSANPLKLVPFYTDKLNKSSENIKYLTDRDLKHSSQPAHFWERIIRVYCKEKSLSSTIAPLVEEAFNSLNDQAGALSPVVRNSKVPESPNPSQEQVYLFPSLSQGTTTGKRTLFNATLPDIVDDEPLMKRPRMAAP